MANWQLPENIADILPSEARKIEHLRRLILDLLRSYGYEIVVPPTLEYLESLLTGTGHDLDLCTFKLVDQLSGRTLGLRADITPQAARIDAHLLNRSGTTRLCYVGKIFHTRATDLFATREPLQIGAEVFGHGGIEADLEIQTLALDCLRLCACGPIHLDMSHAGLIAALLKDSATSIELKAQTALFEALAIKDIAAIKRLSVGLDAQVGAALLLLPELYGDISVLKEARRFLPNIAGISVALDQLEWLSEQCHDAEVSIDLSDMRGYHYHTGVMFAAYTKEIPSAIARGGRYDQIGQAFGRARPATGFSLDLRKLVGVSTIKEDRRTIGAPWGLEPELRLKIAELRSAGEVVIQSLDQNNHFGDDCDRLLVKTAQGWELVPNAN